MENLPDFVEWLANRFGIKGFGINHSSVVSNDFNFDINFENPQFNEEVQRIG